MKSAKFTHAITSKIVTLFYPDEVTGMIHGVAKSMLPTGVEEVAALFLIIKNVPNLLPVRETEEEVLKILGRN